MPYKTKKEGNKTCVYNKITGAKRGCTKGPIKKYMAALHANVKENVFETLFDEVLTESFRVVSNFHDTYNIQFPNGKVYTGPIRGYHNQEKIHDYIRHMNWKAIYELLKSEGWFKKKEEANKPKQLTLGI